MYLLLLARTSNVCHSYVSWARKYSLPLQHWDRCIKPIIVACEYLHFRCLMNPYSCLFSLITFLTLTPTLHVFCNVPPSWLCWEAIIQFVREGAHCTICIIDQIECNCAIVWHCCYVRWCHVQWLCYFYLIQSTEFDAKVDIGFHLLHLLNLFSQSQLSFVHLAGGRPILPRSQTMTTDETMIYSSVISTEGL